MTQRFDVAIVGAGLVGLTLALVLARGGLKVAILESGVCKSVAINPDEYQLRVSAINSACQKLFEDLGCWEGIRKSKRVSSFEKMFVWDSLGRGEIKFDCQDIGEPSLGFILENAILHNALLEQVVIHPHIAVLDNCVPLALEMDADTVAIKFSKDQARDQTQKIVAELLVGADGANSWVRQQAKIDCVAWPYHHQAFVTTVATEKTHQRTAWQCFTPKGPLALLPLADEHTCSVVWSLPNDEIKRLTSLDEQQLNLDMSNNFEYRLGFIRKISPEATFPLYMRHAKRYINQRVALIGDAAHTIHPLAGQGVNLGFADAKTLAEDIFAAKNLYRDAGHYLSLRHYERQRKSDNWVMIFGLEFLKRLFESESFATVSLRSLGLGCVNKLNVIKNQFTYRALGR